MPLDQFFLHVLNNVQLLPNDLEGVGRRIMDEAKYS